MNGGYAGASNKHRAPSQAYDAVFRVGDMVVWFRAGRPARPKEEQKPLSTKEIETVVVDMKALPRVNANHPWLKGEDPYLDTPVDVARKARQETGVREWCRENGMLLLGDSPVKEAAA
jgi:hypothetical protein